LLFEGDSNRYFIAKIGDFGISQIYFSQHQQIYQYSNDYYISKAPETLETFIETGRSEVYTFANLMWEMITLKEPKLYHMDGTPYDADETINYIIKGYRLPLPQAEECKSTSFIKYVEIIKSCWDPNPINRPTLATVIFSLKKIRAFLRNLSK